MLNAKAFGGLLKDAFRDFKEDKAQRLGAALAYYSIFSVGPLLLITVAIVGLFFGEASARQEIVGTFDRVIGPTGAEALNGLMESASRPRAGILATIIGFLTLIVGAMGVVHQLKDAMNTVWEVELKERKGIKAKAKGLAKDYAWPFALVLAVGFLLLVSLVMSSALSVVGKFLGNNLPGGAAVWLVVNFLLSLAVITLLFAIMFKALPDAEVAWKDVWLGAIFTAVLFTVGQFLVGIYLGRSSTVSAYGATSSLVVFLVWVYYSAQIFLFGAELTQAYANRYGSKVQPDEDAVPVTEEARRQRGEGGRPA
ncbi:MAG TPA: YihY/virulence factor BrkB family protein [Candidatus Thermoplasmatota archaeon]|nr:YihY/virulence factor BrkB family protein [Candidatus Thermoplasmatota archaeon]